MRAQLFGTGPSLDRWLATAGTCPAPAGVVRGALNEVCRFVRTPYTFAADPVDRFAHAIPYDTALVTTTEALANARQPAPGCQVIVAEPGHYRGSIVLACSWLLAHRGIREFELVGIDGGTARAALPWISPPSLCSRSYDQIRAALFRWAQGAGVALTFWHTADVCEPRPAAAA